MGGLEERVFGRLPDETWIYPGHGNDSTLGAERPHLEEWRARAGKISSSGVTPAQFWAGARSGLGAFPARCQSGGKPTAERRAAGSEPAAGTARSHHQSGAPWPLSLVS
jgi:glyoxylase-like metal-dependent hydrolase (beta-lactamase superfamily II)